MADLTVQTSDLDGLVVSYDAATGGGDTFDNDGKTVLHVKNGGGSPVTVTVAAVLACNRGTLHDSVTSVAAGAEAMIGPFDKQFFTASTGKASVAYSGVTSVTVAAIKVPTVQ
jgi:hypothetical protein